MDRHAIADLGAAYRNVGRVIQGMLHAAARDPDPGPSMIADEHDPLLDPLRLLLMITGLEGLSDAESLEIAALLGLEQDGDPMTLVRFVNQRPELTAPEDLAAHLLALAVRVDQAMGTSYGPLLRSSVRRLADSAVTLDETRKPAAERLVEPLA